MTAVTAVGRDIGAGPRRARAVRALARVESRRMLRHPVLWVGAVLTTRVTWSTSPDPDEWVGASYEEAIVAVVPFLFAASVVSAVSFHRERLDVAGAAPTGEPHRFLARLLAALPLIVISIGISAFIAWRQRHIGGLTLGVEPGRTSEALFTAGELAQPVALTVLAIAFGAAVGRRMAHLFTVVPILFVVWLATSVYWFFSDRRVTPFSIVQVQPVRLHAGPSTADPLTFPASWLLEAPDEFTDAWMRVVVSEPLAWWHAIWLLGLSGLWLAAALPSGPSRRPMLVAGATLAVLGVGAQYAVLR
jgi:hypothetical protein